MTNESGAATRADRVSSYAEVAAQAASVREFFAQKGIRVHKNSALGVLLREAEVLAKEWEAGTNDGGIARLINAAHANRVADAIDAIRTDTNADECLRRIAGHDVNLSGRAPSQGKDALWEIELLAYLRRRAITANLVEPPDIVIDLNGEEYAVACKKVYSERGVEVQTRKGVHQLKASGLPGIVAINIDDLVPGNSLLSSPTLASAGEFMSDFIVQFINRNQPKIQRFIVDGRCDGILVSASVPSDIKTASPRFNNHSQTVLWTLKETGSEAKRRIQVMRTMLGAP